MRCHNCAASPETLNNAKYIVYKNSTLREMEVLEKINKRRRKPRFLKNKLMKPRLKTGLLGTLSLISQKQQRNKAADEGERECFLWFALDEIRMDERA